MNATTHMNAITQRLKKITADPKTSEVVTDIAAYLFILLFLYTAHAKFSDMEAFENVLSNIELIGSAASLVAWTIPAAETVIAVLLIVPRLRITGLKASLALMILFTGYLLYMVLTASSLPCHCGGVISTLSWNEHILFNAGFTALAAAALLFNKQKQLCNI